MTLAVAGPADGIVHRSQGSGQWYWWGAVTLVTLVTLGLPRKVKGDRGGGSSNTAITCPILPPCRFLMRLRDALGYTVVTL